MISEIKLAWTESAKAFSKRRAEAIIEDVMIELFCPIIRVERFNYLKISNVSYWGFGVLGSNT